jgi:serine protease AprX
MSQVKVLIEFDDQQPKAFGLFELEAQSIALQVESTEGLLARVSHLGVEPEREAPPVPMLTQPEVERPPETLRAFATAGVSEDIPSATRVVAARVPEESLGALREQPGVRVWPNSEMTLYRSAAAVDCAPFRPAATVEEIQALLGVEEIWDEGHTGQGMVVGIVDEGIDGSTYPVTGGFFGEGFPAPGSAPVTSHGSMCAADVLVAAPDAKLYDYHFLGVPDSHGALEMFQSVLAQRRLDGTPHVINNSYGFVRVPPREEFPEHEIWDFQHPVHRKLREVVASGVPAFFAAGNCGAECPAPKCHASGVGPGHSIHGANSLVEAITVAAVNKEGVRIGYSSQGPGMFHPEKPDIAAYSHFFGNFGPGRPGGTVEPFDNGTSAASPVACGVGALLLGARPGTTPLRLKQALGEGANPGGGGWDPDLGAGVIHAASALALL